MAYEQVAGTLGPERGDILHGIHTAAIVNALRGKGRKARPQDFVPKWDRAPQDWETMLAAVKTMNKAMGGRDLRKTDTTTASTTDETGGGGRRGRDRRHPRGHRRQDR